MKDTTETVCQRNSSEIAQPNFVKLCSCKGHTMQMCIFTGNFDSIFLRVTPYLAKMKDTTETVCQRNSSETAQQNFLKLCSNEGHNVQMCISTGNFDSIQALLELRNLTKMKDTTETVCQRNSSEAAKQNFVKLCS